MSEIRAALLCLSGVAACFASSAAFAASGKPKPVTHALLHDAAGVEHGEVELTPHKGGLHAIVTVRGLAAGQHGMHLHAVGTCTAPDFASAGGHWNPDMKQHGHMNPMGPHRGDLPQLVVAADGTGKANFEIAATQAELTDADGTALVIHAAADDERTDPSGNSGARLLCAELR